MQIDATPSPARVRERLATSLRRASAWLAAQLVVVFLGVYAAAWVADRQEAAARDRRAVQLRRALVTELHDMTAGTRNAARGTAQAIAFYDSAWKAGGRPALQPVLDPVRVTPDMWRATVAGGGLELLDVPTFYRLSQFYNALDAGFDVLGQIQRLSESQLLPVSGGPAERFYDPATGKLRGEYAWYPASLHRLNQMATRLTVQADTLAASLERGIRER